MPELSTPIRVEKTKMPASVTSSMISRKVQPMSPPTVPASMVRISDSQTASAKDSGEPPSCVMPPMVMMLAKMTTMTSEMIASHPMSAPVPAAMVLSNQ